MQPRPYQHKFKSDIYKAWQSGARNVLGVLATRGGKTVTFADIIKEHRGASVVIAHRQELIGQISLTLARFGVKHKAIAPKKVIRFLIQQHVDNLGKTFYDPMAPCAVACVDTLIRRENIGAWAKQVTLWVQDEAHHVLSDNKWGKAAAMFPNAKGLGVTANTIRTDGKGLGRKAYGVMDTVVESVGLFDLIKMGFATPYRILSPQSKDLNLAGVGVSKRTGEYNRNQLIALTRKSSVIGDVVKHYIKFARGKLGITFATDVRTAQDISDKFNAAGVPAAVVSAKTPGRERLRVQEQFKRREILQMVNVDLFGEGYDVPAIEVVSMARATTSFNLFCQQFARGLTVMAGKKEAIILDHVGNCVRFALTHGMPDSKIEWSLDSRDVSVGQKKDPDLIPVKYCLNPDCMSVYESIHKLCPHCGHYVPPKARTGPDFVDGDLEELDPETLEEMRAKVRKIDRVIDGPYPGLTGIAALGATKQHKRGQEGQRELRDSIALWAGYHRAMGRSDSESYRRFYFLFGMDVLTAKTLGRSAAAELTAFIRKEIGKLKC